MKEYIIEPFSLKEEKVLVSNGIPFKQKGKTATIATKKNFVRAAFNLMLAYLPTEKDFVKGAL